MTLVPDAWMLQVECPQCGQVREAYLPRVTDADAAPAEDDVVHATWRDTSSHFAQMHGENCTQARTSIIDPTIEGLLEKALEYRLEHHQGEGYNMELIGIVSMNGLVALQSLALPDEPSRAVEQREMQKRWLLRMCWETGGVVRAGLWVSSLYIRHTQGKQIPTYLVVVATPLGKDLRLYEVATEGETIALVRRRNLEAQATLPEDGVSWMNGLFVDVPDDFVIGPEEAALQLRANTLLEA